MKRLFLALFIFFPVLVAAEEHALDLQKQKLLVRELYDRGLYRNASVEAERLSFYYPDHEPDEWLFFRAVAMYRAGDYDASLYLNERRDTLRTALLARGCYMSMRGFAQAYDVLAGFRYENDDPSSWLILTSRVDILLETGSYALAADELRRYGEMFPGSTCAGEFYSEIEKYKNMHPPCPWTAVGLSALLPGAGQFYAGRKADGILSLASVVLAAGASALCFMNGYADLGWTFGFFTGLFYTGTLYGAWNSAKEKTVSMQKDFVHGIRSSHIPVYEPEKDLRRDRLFD